MFRESCIALALGLSGWLPLSAQQPVWRPASRPQPAATTPAEFGIQIGKPIPIVRGSSAILETPPIKYPPAHRSGLAFPHHESTPRPIATVATVPPPGAVIAVSGRNTPAMSVPHDDLGIHSDQFAVDRHWQHPATRPTPHRPMNAPIQMAGNWQQGYPVDAPIPGPMPTLNPIPVPAPAEPQMVPSALAEMNRPTSAFYLRGEYLLWWIKNDNAPPLVTTGDPTNPNIPGALDQPDTEILQDGTLNRNGFSGLRLTAGYWFDGCGDKAIELSGFFLGQKREQFTASSANFPLITRPFFNGNQMMESVQFVSLRGTATGRVTIDAPSQLYGLEANLLCNCCRTCDSQLNVLAGIRYLNLRESLTIVEDIQNLPLSQQPINVDPFNGTRVLVADQFSTRNQFYGTQVGVDGRWQSGRFFVEGRGTLGLGWTHQTVSVNGFQRFPPGTPNVENLPGGLLALNSNIGTRSQNRFTVVPEGRIAVGYQLAAGVRALVGYNFLYWSSVVRPGDQIDRTLDLTRIPNFDRPPGTVPLSTPRPAPLINTTDFWAHGLTLGLEISF